MKVTWSPQAKRDLADIARYIATDDPLASREIRARFYASARRLEAFPFLGKAGALPETRELISHPSCRPVYEIREDVVWITAVFHTRRRWPPAED